VAAINEYNKQKSAQRDANTARWLYSKTDPKIFALPQTPLPEARDRQNFISWRRSLPSPTDPVWWRSMHAISSYRGNRHRPPVRPSFRHRRDRLK